MNVVEFAEYVARKYHAGQFRRDGKTPYITHPEAVARRIERNGGTPEEIAVAWMHDVFEDTQFKFSEEENSTLFSTKAILALAALTKFSNCSYQEYLNRVKANPIARKVKIQDMLCNLSDDPSKEQVAKYSHGLLYLMD